jgi:hypothetical protein
VENHSTERIHSEPVVLEIGGEQGALILYTGATLHGKEIEVSPETSPAQRTHTAVLERHVNGRVLFAAVFPALPAGSYTIWGLDGRPVAEATVSGGCVTEMEWPVEA